MDICVAFMHACMLINVQTHNDKLTLQGLSEGYTAGMGQSGRAASHLSVCWTPPLLTSAENRTKK